MPYRCVHCSEIYQDDAGEILSGCVCGSKFFFYIKEEKLQQILKSRETEPQLTESEKDQIEADVREMTGMEDQPETPVYLDFESIRILKPGKYLLDLGKLFTEGKPQIYQLEDGKYIVDLSTMQAKSN